MILEQPLYIGASHKSGINTIADVIRLAKEKPGEVSYAATGRGRLTHLTMELLQAAHRHQAPAHPLRRRTGAGDERRHERPRAAGARRLCGPGAGDQGRPDQGARVDRAQAAARVREPADDRRNRSELLRRRLERDGGAGRHARRRSSARSTPTCASRSTIRTSRPSSPPTAASCATRRRRRSSTFVQSEQKTWRPILEQVAKDAAK